MLRTLDLALFAFYTAASVSGLLIVKSAMPRAQALWADGVWASGALLLVMVGAGLYVASFLVWLVILSRNELSVAYPVAIGLTLVFSSAAASVMLGETLSLIRVVGIAVIFVGVWTVASS